MSAPTSLYSSIQSHTPGISVLHVYHLAREDCEPHFHKVIELGVCTVGHGTAVTDGVEQRFSAGDYQIVFPFQTHQNHAQSDDCTWKWSFLDPWQLAAITGARQPLFTELMERIRLYGILRAEEHPAICACIGELIACTGKDEPYRSERICALLTLLLLDLAAVSAGGQPVTIPPRFHAISSALILLGERLDAGILPTASELADACGMPDSTFRRVFSDVLGMPPKRYITLCALQKAAMLLSATDKSVTEIAGLSGFTEISTFNRAFRGAMGMTPADYRAANG